MEVETRRRRSPGEILPDACYTAAELCRRLGLGDSKWREAQKKGLRVHRFGQKIYVLGSDWIAFLRTLGDDGEVTGK